MGLSATWVGAWLRWPRLKLAASVLVCYALVLIVPHFLPTTGPVSRTFNSMLDHLMHGRFDVDPAIVGKEGFARDGRVYAYWGPVPAILRLPIIILPQWRLINFTIPYCAVALFWMGAVKIWTVRFVLRNRPTVPRPLARAMYLVIALSGAQMCFLRFSIYQEVCLWAGLFSAVFVAAAIVAQHQGLGERERLVMASAAGAALLTRVSIGIGLIAAFGLLLFVEAVSNRAHLREQIRKSMRPLIVLAVAGIATAWVNYARWGDPLTFADYKYYLFNLKYPDRLARTAAYGLFNFVRIPFGIIYYFLPVWVLHGSDGQLLFEATRFRLIDAAELPPSSFLLTDPLLLALGGVALVRWLGQRRLGAAQGGAIAAGLAIPPLLMLTAISMCFRYRMDFYPLIEFLAFSGLAMIRQRDAMARPWLVSALAAVSVLSSVAVSVAYVAGKLGPGQLLIGRGVGQYYLSRLGLL
ncbi:hypothetical protein EWE75_11760 [Sphingomonas populi]|uniref:Glycosyltransferase RgtA/B/C/D-like domain-containing protein n=1 Tax=Sphingomonas populi TaxID=2484750 RepID=A0A4Q6XV64_9SPHN|nr:hypothetical protein [Sphingomonas populi]RZF64220.1 hypothetical protein EWE75_11760 [Sphingomonas populi]